MTAELKRAPMSRIAAETLSRKSEIVLSSGFASRVNSLAGVMPDSQEIATLFAPWDSRIRYRANEEKRQHEEPTQEWIDFMKSISHQEDVQLRKAVRNVYELYGIRILGELRDFSEIPGYGRYRIGQRGNAFLFLAFQKPEEAESLTLGL